MGSDWRTCGAGAALSGNNSSASRRSASRCTRMLPNKASSSALLEPPASWNAWPSIASTVAGLGGNCISCLACTQSNKYRSRCTSGMTGGLGFPETLMHA